MTDEPGGYAGGCLCGAIRYQAADPVRVSHCHCANCRRATGSPFGTWAVFRTQDVTFSGAEPARYRASEWAERGFCPTCGGALLFSYDDRPELTILAAASLDDPSAVTPERHIWVKSRLDWIRCGDGLPTHPETSYGKAEKRT